MPLIETKGAASAQGFGEFAQSGPAIYIEDVFSTYLYTGTGATQTITNNIDLSGKGGLVWRKGRAGTYAADWHSLVDTARGASNALFSNTTNAQTSGGIAWPLTSFNSNGFTMPQGDAGGGQPAGYPLNFLGTTYASWTFRKQPKFFDVVTFTTSGTLSSNRSISHSLGSAPGFIIVKSSSNDSNWLCYHRSLGQSSYVALQSTNAQNTSNQWWTATAPTATTFNVDETLLLNTNRTYIAYLFAHNAGGFGLTGTDNVISCGSFTTNGVDGSFSVTTGYEPQWWLVKNTSRPGDWHLVDIMRGATASATGRELIPNLSSAETSNYFVTPTATGFYGTAYDFGGADTYIYIAIRRGPMKVPTSGTSVFSATARTPAGATYTASTAFTVDMVMQQQRTVANTVNQANVFDRLRGATKQLATAQTQAEATQSGITNFDVQAGYIAAYGSWSAVNWTSGYNEVYWNFRRAPSFFDVVCYTGTGSYPQTINHNLGVAPELIIGKQRNGTYGGQVWQKDLGFYSGSSTYGLYLFSSTGSSAKVSSNAFGGSPTSTTFTATTTETASSGNTFVAYLFATCPGVSKVGSYTGTGTTLQINCGFTGGARFVLIKRTDSTGDWYVWDSARGIVAGNDPYLLLNSTAAEVTGTDYVDTYSAGFEISSTAPAAINANGGTFIFLAIA